MLKRLLRTDDIKSLIPTALLLVEEATVIDSEYKSSEPEEIKYVVMVMKNIIYINVQINIMLKTFFFKDLSISLQCYEQS